MFWSDFYLICFLVGFSLSVLSFLAGAVHIHLPFKMHLPFDGAGHGAHGGFHSHGGGVHAHGDGASASSHGAADISWFNASSAMAFLAWFGGIGYILATHSRFVGVAVLAFAVAGGLTASWIVFKFMVKLMNAESSHLKDEDYRHEGLVCTVTMPVRENGTGEIIFMQNGVRRSAGARSCNGQALEKGAEVVIERYENGVAYVHRWEEFTS
ncbi:MAG: NfeD family protein [Acidobacteriota bacterium]|nr:NfeD family protein [Acidobacteriota bacterium]